MIDQPHPLIVQRVIHAMRSQIFKAFSRADLLIKWFTPSTEITLEVLGFDFVPERRFRRFRRIARAASRAAKFGTLSQPSYASID